MTRFIYIIVGLLFSISEMSHSQDLNMNPESIDSILAKAKSLSKIKPDSASLLLKQVKPYVLRSEDPNLMAKHAVHTSWLLLKKENYEDILKVLASNIQNKDNIEISLLAQTYQNIGHVYKMKWVPDSALVNYIKGLKLAEQANDDRKVSLSYLALGLTYSKLGNEELASDFFDKSMKYSTNTDLIKKHREHITDQKIRPVSTDRTIELSLDIVKIAEQQDNQLLMATAYSDLRKEYFKLKNYPMALEYAKKELLLREVIGFTSMTSNAWASIAKIYAIQNRNSKALELYQKALPQANDTLKLSIYQEMKEVYLKNGNVARALNSLEDYTNLKDAVDTKIKEKSIAEVMTRFQTELQAEQIKTLSAENELQESRIASQRISLFGTLAASLLVFILGYFIYRNYNSKQELKYTQLNFKLLQSQMNPHFIFNAFNEINLNLDTQTNENASKNLLAYSTLMRSILQGSAREFVTVEEDIKLISKFLEVQQMGNGHSFDYSIDVAEDLDTHFMEIPPMLTQPFVENAVLHGVRNIDGGHISVSYLMKEDKIYVEIKDNGKGFSQEQSHSGNELHTSMGTSIIAQRIATYKKLHQYEIEQKLLSDKEGTCIILLFPLKLKEVS